MTDADLEVLSDGEIERLHRAGLVSDDAILRILPSRVSPHELATIDAVAYGIAKLFHTPLGQFKAEADPHRATHGGPHVGVAPSAHDQLAHLDQLVALHETFWATLAQRNPTPVTREFLQHHWDPWLTQWWTKRPYLDTDQGLAALVAHHQKTVVDAPGVAHFEPMAPPALAAVVHEAAQGLSSLREIAAYNGIHTPDLGTTQHGFARPEDLVAETAFAAKVSGVESPAYNAQMSAHTGLDYDPTQVGHWFLPLALGVPAGALGGYAYRRWQEGHPGKIIPWISGEVGHSVGGSWGEIVGGSWGEIVGAAPWHSIVGAVAAVDDVARRHAWPKTKALIQSAIREVFDSQGSYPAEAYVWSLESYGGTQVVPFASPEEALQHMRDRIQTDHVALALFDKTSPHWPNPVNWTKSHDPAHEAVIAQQIARHAPAHVAVSGLWDSISNAVLKYTGTSMTNQFIKDHGLEPYVKLAATAVATAYGGPAAGAAAGALSPMVMSLGVRDQQKAEAASKNVHQVTTAAQQHSPQMAQAVDVAKGAIQKAATAYHVAKITKDAKAGDPGAQKALDNLNAAAASGDSDAALALQLASIFHHEQDKTPAHAAGEIVGAGPWHTIVGAAIDVLRRQAKVAAEEMPGHVIGVRRDAHNQWQLKSFRSTDDADDWFGHAIAEPRLFTYAAYFEKDASGIPYLENEAIGGARAPSVPGASIPRVVAEV